MQGVTSAGNRTGIRAIGILPKEKVVACSGVAQDLVRHWCHPVFVPRALLVIDDAQVDRPIERIEAGADACFGIRGWAKCRKEIDAVFRDQNPASLMASGVAQFVACESFYQRGHADGLTIVALRARLQPNFPSCQATVPCS